MEELLGATTKVGELSVMHLTKLPTMEAKAKPSESFKRCIKIGLKAMCETQQTCGLSGQMRRKLNYLANVQIAMQGRTLRLCITLNAPFNPLCASTLLPHGEHFLNRGGGEAFL